MWIFIIAKNPDLFLSVGEHTNFFQKYLKIKDIKETPKKQHLLDISHT